MEKVFETEKVKLYTDGEKVIGNVSQEEAYKTLEKEGVKAIGNMDFEKVIEMATLSTKVITNYEQLKEESSEDPIEDDEILSNLLEIITEAYEENRLDELFTKMTLTSKLSGESILDIMTEFTKTVKG
jgi:oligoribonuclease (3'-5' exoribonuclease)